MSYEVIIEDYVHTRISKSVRLTIPYKLNSTYCIAYVEFVDKDGLVASNANLYISTEEYTLWTYNDEYIINIVLQKLGLIRQSIS